VNRTHNASPGAESLDPPRQNFAIAPDRTNRDGASLADRNHARPDRLAGGYSLACQAGTGLDCIERSVSLQLRVLHCVPRSVIRLPRK